MGHLVLAYALSPLLEKALRQSLILAGGTFTIFLTRPISIGCLILTGVLLITSILPMIRKVMVRIITESEKNG